MRVLDQNLEILRNFKPLSEEQISALRAYGKQFEDGRYELFKSTVKYDGDLGRTQHDFPLGHRPARLNPASFLERNLSRNNVAKSVAAVYNCTDFETLSDSLSLSSAGYCYPGYCLPNCSCRHPLFFPAHSERPAPGARL